MHRHHSIGTSYVHLCHLRPQTQLKYKYIVPEGKPAFTSDHVNDYPPKSSTLLLFELSATLCKSHHHQSLKKGAISDLAWWHKIHKFLKDWDGVSLLAATGGQEPTVTLISDASGKWGCGAFWNSWWFQLAWSDTACTGEVNIQM